jgi:Domain of Unknown Function (DUF1206)
VSASVEARRLGRSVREVGREVENSRWLNWLARAGLAAKGVSYALVGVLALEVAVGAGGKATSRQGALADVAHHSWGKVLLTALAIGFAGYAIWRFAQTFFDRSNQGDGPKGLALRAGYFGRGLIYAGLTVATVRLLTMSDEPTPQNKEAHEKTAMVLSWPAGRWLVGAAGVCLIGAGLYNGYRGLSTKFLDRWQASTQRDAPKWGARAGVVGLLARLVVFCLIGVFVIKAAYEYDPREAVGLDGALQKLAHHSYGSWLLGAVAVGLLAYAVFCAFEARYRRV